MWPLAKITDQNKCNKNKDEDIHVYNSWNKSDSASQKKKKFCLFAQLMSFRSQAECYNVVNFVNIFSLGSISNRKIVGKDWSVLLVHFASGVEFSCGYLRCIQKQERIIFSSFQLCHIHLRKIKKEIALWLFYIWFNKTLRISRHID